MKSTKLPSWIETLLGLDPLPPPPHTFALYEGGRISPESPFSGMGEGAQPAMELHYGSFHRGPQGFVYDAAHNEVIAARVFGEGPLGAPIQDLPAFEDAVKRLVGNIEAPIKEASLVLPDAWLRLIFTEVSDLPRRADDIQDVLRWKLKRIVPFRVEELRVSSTEVVPFPNQEEPRRLLLGFALETLIEQIESAFGAAGITLGRITNNTLALQASLDTNNRPEELSALVAVSPFSFTVSYVLNGLPLLYRFKALPAGAAEPKATIRDLRLTANFVSQNFPDKHLARLYLAALPEEEEHWVEVLRQGLDVEPEPLAFQHFPLSRTQVGPSWAHTAPLLGAASLEV